MSPRYLVLFLALPLLAQQPSITNAKLEAIAVMGTLDDSVRQLIARHSSPAWVGYAVTRPAGDRQSCCWDGSGRGCGLESKSGMAQNAAPAAVKLEGVTHTTVLLRAEAGRIGRVRAFSGDCPLDAGGLPLYWLNGVKPDESVAFLARKASSPATEAGGRTVSDEALHALAMHEGKTADAALVRIAKQDPAARVRGQALFWLAQKASNQAQIAIADSIEQDPDTEVKKKAVFALTQLPSGDGVPKLIEVARTNRNLAVRKQAMFWLGQSKDPRALRFFEEVLSSK